MELKRVLVLVEGPTEKGFVNNVLAEHFLARSMVLAPTLGKIKGHGVGTYARIRKDIQGLLGSNPTCVTTMLDYYKFPKDVSGRKLSSRGSCHQKVERLEARIQTDIGDQRFVPHLVLHEYEGLLFSSPDDIEGHFAGDNQLLELRRILRGVRSPEEIDDGPDTSPSHLLKRLYPEYDKVVDGVQIAKRIGLAAIREQCPHFNDWLARLEALGTSGA